MATPQPHRGPTFKLFVTAALSAALVAAPTAAAQTQTDSASDVDITSSQNVQVSPDPAPPPAPPVQPTPDPVPAPEPADTSGGGGSAPAPPPEPAAPAPAEPAPAQPAPEAAPPPTPVAATATSEPPSQTGAQQSPRRGDRGKPQSSEKDRSTPVDKVNTLPVLSELGPLANGLRDRATEAAPPIAIAAVALLILALTSGGFLAVATRRTGAWRT
jgi:hypothetical protein